ncbi:two-component system sensor histidine kinase NtrB [Chlamydiifrater phoenicopteri]|uniref:two-component system sensor histidine kinase NtrB n=1 Tax=Chlamydiifrater phoenicopteri TaxID=2681469 RepID=UPI001BCE2EE0|nr:ATP-binding protein [Chlamydiifrater phoenicopteri]
MSDNIHSTKTCSHSYIPASQKQLPSSAKKISSELSAIVSRLKKSSRETEYILSSIPDGIFLIAQNGSITVCNTEAKTILGFPENYPLLHQSFFDVFPDAFLGFSVSEALKNLPTPKTVALNLEEGGLSKDLEVFVRRCGGNDLDDSPYLFIMIRDRSMYKQLENALERYKNISEIGRLAATLAHEIRNPLTGIEGFASLLKEELSSPRHKRMAQSIVDGTRSLNSLVSSILEYTRPNPLNLKATNLIDFITSLEPLLTSTFPSYKQEIKAKDSIIKSMDPDRIKSVLWNLVKNACEAAYPGTSVVLCLEENGDISVTNQGETIPSEIFKNLFTPFFTTKASGNGLGLPEAKKVMNMHGGEITVSSVNDVTSFVIKIP